MKIELEDKCDLEYIRFLSKILGVGMKFPEKLYELIDEGYVSNSFLSSDEIMSFTKENNNSFKKERIGKKTSNYHRLYVEVSQFKSKGVEANLFNSQKGDKNNTTRDIVLSSIFFTQNGVMTDKAKLVLEFNKGQLFAYNPTLSETPQLLKSDIDGIDYYTILTMMDKKKNTRDLNISKTLGLFKDGSYQFEKGNRDYIKVGFKLLHNLKSKLVKGRDMGVFEEKSPLLFSLNKDVIPSVEWLHNFKNEVIKLSLNFKDNQVEIKKI